VCKVTDRFFDAVPALREAGIEADEWQTPVPPEYGRTEAVARGAMEAFAARLADEGRGWLPDLLVFTDDYVTSGALLSLNRAGIRVPDDVRVVTISNKGLGPVYPISFTRIENDPDLHGDRIADSVLAFLSGHSMRVRNLVPQYIVGETFP
jgi:DNA-binding LacI/PurR family transcriptional regulator